MISTEFQANFYHKEQNILRFSLKNSYFASNFQKIDPIFEHFDPIIKHCFASYRSRKNRDFENWAKFRDEPNFEWPEFWDSTVINCYF